MTVHFKDPRKSRVAYYFHILNEWQQESNLELSCHDAAVWPPVSALDGVFKPLTDKKIIRTIWNLFRFWASWIWYSLNQFYDLVPTWWCIISFISLSLSFSLSLSLSLSHTHTLTNTHTFRAALLAISHWACAFVMEVGGRYIMCVCECAHVCVCVWEREREGGRERA